MRNRIFLSALFLFLLSMPAGAQNKIEKEKIQDAFKEAETGNLSMHFFDALSGAPVKEGKVVIEKAGEFVTDFEGVAEFPAPPEDGYLKVKFEHPNYVTSEFRIEIMAGTIFFNRFSVSPRMPAGSLRVVVDWGEDPRDLDAHFVKSGGYHISFRKMVVAADGSAKLDRDDTDGNGPETVTANSVDANATYTYFVHDFSNMSRVDSRKLSESKATVKVFNNNRLSGVYEVPRDKAGTYWEVFRIVNGMVQEVNEIKNSEP